MSAARQPAQWLALLAPLPDHAVPRRGPVAAPGTPGAGPASPIADWDSVIVELSDMPFGTRILMVTLDGAGAPISASDHVVFRAVEPGGPTPDGPVHMRQESVGGRIEADGSFRGTHWIVEGPEPIDDEPPAWTQIPRPPTEEEVARLLALVRDIVARSA